MEKLTEVWTYDKKRLYKLMNSFAFLGYELLCVLSLTNQLQSGIDVSESQAQIVALLTNKLRYSHLSASEWIRHCFKHFRNKLTRQYIESHQHLLVYWSRICSHCKCVDFCKLFLTQFDCLFSQSISQVCLIDTRNVVEMNAGTALTNSHTQLDALSIPSKILILFRVSVSALLTD